MINEFINLPWTKIFLLFGVFYIFIVIAAWIYADRILFPFPEPVSYREEAVDFFVEIENGFQVACISITPKDPNGLVILYSHGNGEDLGMIMDRLSEIAQKGYTVFSYDYPGYGLSTGSPSENSCYEAVQALFSYLVEGMNVSPSRIVLWGRSLGTGPSCYLASKNKLGGLLLETPFLSAFRALTVITILPWDRFRNIDFVQSVKCPSLVIHGKLDEVVPFRQGRRIYKELPEPKSFLEIQDAGHNNLKEKGKKLYFDGVANFLNSILKD